MGDAAIQPQQKQAASGRHMKPGTRLLLPAVLAYAFSGALLAQGDRFPGVGTWVLNIAKSTYQPGPAPQSEMRTYELTSDGIRVTVHQISAKGTVVTETSTYKLDGKPYSFAGSPLIDAIAVTRVNALETYDKLLLKGRVVGRLTHIVSKDGKTLTLTMTAAIGPGHREHDVRVYDRQ